jgi:hypothetical protein
MFPAVKTGVRQDHRASQFHNIRFFLFQNSDDFIQAGNMAAHSSPGKIIGAQMVNGRISPVFHLIEFSRHNHYMPVLRFLFHVVPLGIQIGQNPAAALSRGLGQITNFHFISTHNPVSLSHFYFTGTIHKKIAVFLQFLFYQRLT